jgi:hypothetical protein
MADGMIINVCPCKLHWCCKTKQIQFTFLSTYVSKLQTSTTTLKALKLQKKINYWKYSILYRIYCSVIYCVKKLVIRNRRAFLNFKDNCKPMSLLRSVHMRCVFALTDYNGNNKQNNDDTFFSLHSIKFGTIRVKLYWTKFIELQL